MRRILILALIGFAFGLVLKLHSGGNPIGICMLVALVGAPIIGTVATIDDDLPGGWSNPNGGSRPEWLHWRTPVQLVLMASVSGVGFAVDSAPDIAKVLLWLLVGAGGLVGTRLFLKQWPEHRSS
jgi:hypothetical protein